MIGINLGHHDSSICHIKLQNKCFRDVEIILNERVSRQKNAGGFPISALRFFKKNQQEEWQSLRPTDFANNCFDEHPKLTEKEIADKYPDYTTFIEAYDLKIASALYNNDIHYVPHHLSHVYSLWPVCPFEKALVIVSDGAGSEKKAFTNSDEEWGLIKDLPDGKEHFSVYGLDQGVVTPLVKEFFREKYVTNRKLRAGVGLGSHFEYASKLIFNNWNQAGKVMGLSAFGKPTITLDILEYLMSLDESSFEIFNSKEDFDNQSEESFQRSADVAATVQKHFEDQMMKKLGHLKIQYPEYENLILVGGCALNGLLNMKIVNSKLFKNVFVPPFPNDEGIALGCVVKLAHDRKEIEFKAKRIETIHPYLGPIQNDVELQKVRIPEVFKEYKVEELENTISVAAKLLQDNKIVAWMQGRSEVGPRALGNRSILSRPDIPNLKLFLNNHIKYREKFRPYGASVLKELAPIYFEVEENFHSPFMTFCAQVKEEYKKTLSGVTHVDGTCRLQTLSPEQNLLYYNLIKECERTFGLGILLNTSLNTMGEPIVETLEDAKKFFEESEVKYFIIGNFLIRK